LRRVTSNQALYSTGDEREVSHGGLGANAETRKSIIALTFAGGE
jgi:hypothetical protein